MADSRALLRTVLQTVPGTIVLLGVLRDGNQQTVPVTLAERPANQMMETFLGQPGVPKPELPPEARVNFGLQMAAITPELRARYRLGAQQQGVVITGVAVGSAAANSNINAGTVIVQVRGMAVTSLDDVARGVDDEVKEKRPFVPMLLAEPSGLRWVSLPLD